MRLVRWRMARNQLRKVRKIVGPGGPYVTAAKRQVYGDVALDMVAGPSEIAVLCDGLANQPIWRLIYSRKLNMARVRRNLYWLRRRLNLGASNSSRGVAAVKTLMRTGPIRDVMENGMLLVSVKSLVKA